MFSCTDFIFTVVVALNLQSLLTRISLFSVVISKYDIKLFCQSFYSAEFQFYQTYVVITSIIKV